jgi:hypothetical protein
MERKNSQFARQKINEKNTFLALTYSKIKIFFKILKTCDELNYLAKFVEQLVPKPHFDASESAKTLFFFCFGRTKSPVKGLNSHLSKVLLIL